MVEIEIGVRLMWTVLVLGLILLSERWTSLYRKLKMSQSDILEMNLRKSGNVIKDFGRK